MQPTKERNPSAIYINYETENLLFDCGEGTQRQMRLKGLKPTKITRVLLSHYHGDHILGLPGFLSNLKANEYKTTLHIYGPKGIEKLMSLILEIARIKSGELKIELHELKEGKIFETEKFEIESYILKHSIPSYGFIFKEKDKRKINIDYTSKFGLKQHPIFGELQKGKDITFNGKKIKSKSVTYTQLGKKVTIILDTAKNQNTIQLAKNSDLLICESTYSADESEQAKEYKHLTTSQAAEIAKKAKVKQLALVHISDKHLHRLPQLLKEAKKVFKNTLIPEDLEVLKV